MNTNPLTRGAGNKNFSFRGATGRAVLSSLKKTIQQLVYGSAFAHSRPTLDTLLKEFVTGSRRELCLVDGCLLEAVLRRLCVMGIPACDVVVRVEQGVPTCCRCYPNGCAAAIGRPCCRQMEPSSTPATPCTCNARHIRHVWFGLTLPAPAYPHGCLDGRITSRWTVHRLPSELDSFVIVTRERDVTWDELVQTAIYHPVDAPVNTPTMLSTNARGTPTKSCLRVDGIQNSRRNESRATAGMACEGVGSGLP